MKSKYSIDYKIDILERGIDKEVATIKRECYKRAKVCYIIDSHEGTLIDKNIDMTEWANWLKDNIEKPKYDCALRLNKSKYNKAKKVRDKIAKLCEGDKAVFITLTFTDEVLSKTSPQTRRRYVARYLKEQSNVYVANVDYSPDKHREHYHAVIEGEADFSKWPYGFVYAEHIRTSRDDLMRTSKYVSKLTSHALKVCQSTPRLIYSRDTL